MPQRTIMICAGGTGGHMFPALALAQDLLSRDCKVIVVTDDRAVKYTQGYDGLKVHVISSATLGGGVVAKVKGLIQLAKGYVQSKKIIKQYRPRLAVGFGGYPSVPPMVAAQRNGMMTMIHEANAVLGRANAFLATKADRIALSLPDYSSLDEVDQIRAVVTGNPIRSDIAGLYAHPYSVPEDDSDFYLSVMGGSLGAKVMANIVPKAVELLPEDLKVRLNITQQCHDEDIADVKTVYADAGVSATLKPFIDNVPDVLKHTHLMIARSGASTVSELAVAGIPTIYIPYPHHADQQQKVNAQIIERAGGAWVMEEKEITPQMMADKLENLMRHPEALFDAAEAARSCSKPEATRKLGNLAIALIKGWDYQKDKNA